MNHLEKLKQFQEVLANYQVSDSGRQVLKEVNLILLAAPTSAGRNTIIRELLKKGNYHYIVSDTTRKPRVNDGIMEQNGVEYWFRSEEEMLGDLQKGAYLEAAIIHNQQVSGISLRELSQAKDEEKLAVTDIEMAGVDTIIDAKPDTIVIFVIPPNFEEWIRRLKSRGDMAPTEYKRRLESALYEFDHALEEDYYLHVVNDDFHEAVKIIDRVAKTGKIDPDLQAKNRQLTDKLRVATANHLKSLI